MAVAARIRDGLRSTDVAARLGGDEFGVLLLDIPDPAYATAVAERLLAGISAPARGRRGPGRGQRQHRRRRRHRGDARVDDLLSDADVAMYQAKALGKGRQHVFDGNPEGRVVAERPWSADQRTVRRPAFAPARLEPGGRLGPGHRTRLDGAATTSERRADAGPGLMKIPLFPLHTVLCPGIVVPLHIFEERYREMTRRCLDTGEPFGVVLIREGREVGDAQHLDPGRRGRLRGDPAGGALPGRALRPARGRDRAVHDRIGRRGERGVPRRRRDAARRRGGRRAAGRAPGGHRHRPVRALPRAHAGARRRDRRRARHPGRGRGGRIVRGRRGPRRRGHGRGDRRVDDRGRRGARSRRRRG